MVHNKPTLVWGSAVSGTSPESNQFAIAAFYPLVLHLCARTSKLLFACLRYLVACFLEAPVISMKDWARFDITRNIFVPSFCSVTMFFGRCVSHKPHVRPLSTSVDKSKQFYQKHREKILEQTKEYYLNHKEERKLYKHNYHIENKDALAKKRKQKLAEKRLKLLSDTSSLQVNPFFFQLTFSKPYILSRCN